MIIINYDYAIMQYTCPDIGKKGKEEVKVCFVCECLTITVHKFVEVKIEFTKFWELDK